MRKKSYLLLILTSLISTAAYAQKVNVEYDKKTTFSSYKTYSWGEGKPAADPLADKYIVAAIDAQLAAKGWQKVESDSDVVVIYGAGRTTETQINPFAPGGPYSGYRWAWKAASAFDASGLQTVSVGELIVDMADVKNKTFMWTASAKDTLSPDFEKKKKTVDKALAKMFKNFPPTPKQK
jgi:hypothetical protein